MGTRIKKWNYIIMVIFNLDIMLGAMPSTGKWDKIPPESTLINTEFPHHTLTTDTCFIPNLFFSDPYKNKTDYPQDLKQCPNSTNPLLNSNQSHIWVMKKNLQFYNATDDSYFRCCYKSFHLSVGGVGFGRQSTDSTIKYQDCILFNETIEAFHEFVRVYCYYKSKIIDEQIFIFAMPKPNAIPPMMSFLSEPTHAQKQKSYNVLIFGMSSVSLQNFHRTMTETDTVLRNRDVIDFFGYNKYGDTKYSNLIPVLVGHKSSKVECGTKSRNMFIWELYKQQGFFTALVEDEKESSISFCDFAKNPTDYFLKPFLVESADIKHHKYCTGNKYTYKILTEYIDQLCNNLQESKLFGIFWQSSMSTQGWQYPKVTDEDYAALFKNMINNGYLDQTVLILLSDLGTKYSPSKEGYLEERLPMFKMILPPSFRTEFSIAYDNLRLNSQRLITAFDVHSTLIDLADLNAIRDEEILVRTKKEYSDTRGMSLFKPVSSKRTCNSVDIDCKHCICYESKKMYDLMGITARYTAKLIVPVINKMLEPYPQCPYLEYSSLVEISKFTALHLRDNRFMEYLVRVRTTPRGIFEATVRYDSTWSVVSGVSRLDYDERMSYCVDDPLIKLYCFCPWPRVMKLIVPDN